MGAHAGLRWLQADHVSGHDKLVEFDPRLRVDQVQRGGRDSRQRLGGCHNRTIVVGAPVDVHCRRSGGQQQKAAAQHLQPGFQQGPRDGLGFRGREQ